MMKLMMFSHWPTFLIFEKKKNNLNFTFLLEYNTNHIKYLSVEIKHRFSGLHQKEVLEREKNTCIIVS